MGDARSADDRLPWLDGPRAAKPDRASRRARTVLLALLALFCFSAIAVMAYLTGRGTKLVSPAPPSRERVLAPSPAPLAPIAPTPVPVVPLPVVPPAPVVATPAPPTSASVTAETGEARATRATGKRETTARSSVGRRVAARSARDVSVQSTTRRARAAPRRYQWPAYSAAGPSGRVVQLGAYRTGRQTTAAWRRLRRAYPYLRTLPRKVTVTAPRSGRPRYYQLRVGTRSPGEARVLCNALQRIGRGCIIV